MINNTELTMNEQIEKIYGEACIHYGYLDEREFLEKFAELIIKECIAQIQIESCNPYRNVEDLDSYGISACDESIYKIKLHFGVE